MSKRYPVVLSLSSLLLVVGPAGCGGGDGDTPDSDINIVYDAAPPDAPIIYDAPPVEPNLACLGFTPPTTAPATIDVSGSVQELTQSGATAVADADVEVIARADGEVIDSTTSATNGAFAFVDLDTDEVPLDVYGRFSKAGLRDSYFFPPLPLSEDNDQVVGLMATADFTNLIFYQLANVTPMAGKGTGFGLILDCDGAPITGATVTTTPASTIRYVSFAGMFPQFGTTSTYEDGIFLLLNMDADAGGEEITINASYKGMNLRVNKILSFPDAFALTAVIP
jgi:hypothetical protein